ncbi:exported hypothetical protein [Mesorhizobium sp. ORS 3359]|nr:exported hypothetical protein [Mesorhizobium sp. ORS 3359]
MIHQVLSCLVMGVSPGSNQASQRFLRRLSNLVLVGVFQAPECYGAGSGVLFNPGAADPNAHKINRARRGSRW